MSDVFVPVDWITDTLNNDVATAKCPFCDHLNICGDEVDVCGHQISITIDTDAKVKMFFRKEE